MKMIMQRQGQAVIGMQLQRAGRVPHEKIFKDGIIKVQYWIKSWYIKEQYLLNSKYSATSI
jgi:hypothetical protein